MPEKILGLDINEDFISAVQVRSGLKGYQITACGSVMIQEDQGPDDALKDLFDRMDLKSDAFVASIPGENVSYRNLQMPFRDPKKIRQTLSFEIEGMVPFSIEDLIVDFLINGQADQSEILAASVTKDYISEYLSRLQPYRINPGILDIRCVPTVSRLLRQEGIADCGLFLDIGKKRATMILYLKGRIVLVRTFGFQDRQLPGPDLYQHTANNKDRDTEMPEKIEPALKSLCTRVRNTLHAFGYLHNIPFRTEKVFFTGISGLFPETEALLSRFLDVPAEQIDLGMDKRVHMDENIARTWNPPLMNGALSLALRDTKGRQGFNFRKDEFEIKKGYFGPKREFRKAAIFLMIIFSFLAADMSVDYYFLKKKYNDLGQEITGLFKQMFPDVKRIVDPLQQAKVKINEIKASTISIPGINHNNKILDLLRDISERIPKSLDIQITRMGIDPEKVRISGKADTYSTVDSMKNELAASAYFTEVTITSTNLDRAGKGVRFEIKLTRVS